MLLVGMTVRAEAQDHGRLALVIGNQGYADNVGPLKNPHRDVATVVKALQIDGFQVTTVRDATRRQLLSAIRYFAAELAKAGSNAIGFLYDSGHGVSSPEDRQLFDPS